MTPDNDPRDTTAPDDTATEPSPADGSTAHAAPANGRGPEGVDAFEPADGEPGEPLPDALRAEAESGSVVDEAVAPEVDDVSVDGLREQLGAAEARAAEYWERLLRLQADMENQAKRAQKDVSGARRFALESFVKDLLPVKDTMELGLQAAEADDADVVKIREGSTLTVQMLNSVLEKYNVVELNPVDQKFDPEYHQAMTMQAVEGKAANTVVSVMQKGYLLNDRLVRPALVMVAK